MMTTEPALESLAEDSNHNVTEFSRSDNELIGDVVLMKWTT